MTEYGLPLTTPSTQTLIPAVQQSTGMVKGFYAIAETEFDGTETSFTLSDGSVPLLSVTTDPYNVTNVRDADEARVSQFMAAVWPETTEYQLPWRGYSSFVDPAVPNNLGYYAWWSMPTTMWMRHFSFGTYLTSLKWGMDQFNIVDPTAPPNPPVTTPQTLEWAASIELQAFAPECAFLDFNWVTLFQSLPVFDPSQEGNGVVPVRLTTVSNPVGGQFKASVLQGAAGSAGPTVYPGGGVVFNTVRILKLADAVAGDYVFNFSVTYNVEGVEKSSPAVLTLTVI